MGSNSNKKKTKKNISQSESLVYILPLIIAAAITPLIVFYKLIPLDDLSKQYWTDNVNIDFFSYYKSCFIMISAGLALALFLFQTYQKGLNLKKSNIYIPVFVYCLFVILSAALSKYQQVSLNGFADRYEGVYVLLSYIILMLAAMNFLNSEKQIKVFLAVLFVSASILGTIGAFQYFGLDLFKSTFGKQLILPQAAHDLAKSLNFTFDKYTIYSTLYNTNFVGSYTAMLFPLAFLLFLFTQKSTAKILLGAFTVIMYVNWLGCNSRGGYVGVIFVVFITTLFLRRELLRKGKEIGGMIAVFIIIFFIMNTVSNGGIVGGVFKEAQVVTKAPLFGFKDIDMEGKKIIIFGKKDKLTLEMKDNQMYFLDENNNVLEFSNKEDVGIGLSDSRYQGISFYQEQGTNLLNIFIDDKQLTLQMSPEGIKIAGQRGMLIDQIKNVRSIGFKGRETFASSRGYIWSKSFPLLIDHAIVGSGPDTYVFDFPQYDAVGKLKAFNKVNEVVDKPHNLFLQIGINTGGISLLAFLAFLLIYFIQSFKLYFKREYSTFIERVGLASFIAMCGYLMTAMFNDSLVSVAPVFWVLLGLGISCNYHLSKKTTAPLPLKQLKQ